jgi:hypothetical protein
METQEEREARLRAAAKRIGGVFQDASGSQIYTSMYDIEADAREWATGLHWAMDEELKTGKTYSASDVEIKWHVEPIFITLKEYLKKSPGPKLGKEVYRSAYNQGVRIESKDGEKAYPKAWLEMFFGNLDELAKFLKD